MSCPLCGEGLRQNLLLTNLAVVACPSEDCVFPFNLSIAEMELRNLILRVSELVIMEKMHVKLQNAKIEQKVANFISRSDEDIMGI